MAENESTAPPRLPMTIEEASLRWKMSKTVIKRKIAMGLIQSERVGGGGTRAAAVLIWQADPPARVERGTLTPDQRAAWNKGGRGKVRA